jgi:glycerol-3-phosphate dehydrogenase
VKRNVTALAEKEYDLVIVGGGIFGICVAWDAVLRGISVALVERGDFAHATSANCFKMVHGGIRYLQHGDLPRIRESSKERNVLLRIAPHLVAPLPFVVPTYGHGMRGKEILCAALAAYNLITFDRNCGIADAQKRIAPGLILSRKECLELFPGLERNGLTGAVVFYDAQMYSPARLALCYLKSAAEAGANAANYLEATGFLRKKNRVYGIKARDLLSNNEMEIRGKVVVNSAGPWAGHLVKDWLGLRLNTAPIFSRDVFFLVRRRLHEKYALALEHSTRDADAILSRGHRHLFLVPWRNYMLVGVWHAVHKGDPSTFTFTADDLEVFVEEINAAYPAIALTRRDVSMWHAGLILFGDNDRPGSDLSYGKRSQLIDHSATHDIDGIVTIIGVRYTTSRSTAEAVVDLVFKKLGKAPPRSLTAVTPVYGGQIENFGRLQNQVLAERSFGLNAEILSALVHNHGSRYQEVLKYGAENPAWTQALGSSNVIKAEVIHACREEMAHKLSDVAFRRTNLGTGEYPGDSALQACAALMSTELGWDKQRVRREVEETAAAFPHASQAGPEEQICEMASR